ncbi:hypothetical protein C8R44DRAFT_895051 [Mycena epipterygia]|nr:hypothetical protein C8R44DRAFT_895051 [Mycena epipterygia]
MNSEDSLPCFPLELEREIFESAAELHPETIPSLLLVSQRVHEWIERVKYNTVAPSGSGTSCRLDVLQRAVRSDSKPASFFHDRVHHLFVERLEVDEVREILSACTGIWSLVLMLSTGPSILADLGVMSLQRLSFHLRGIFTTEFIDLSHSMFTSITHLDLFDLLDDSDSQGPRSNLALLPALTHLSLFKFRNPTVRTELLSKCKKLEVLIRMTGGAFDADDLPSVDDVRFVSMVLSDDDYEEDWIVGTKGGMDFWARADAFVAKKRRGEIKPDSRCWIEQGDGI